MASELFRLTIAEACKRLARREISAVELTRACLDRAAAMESRLNAFITLCAREAMEQAESADQRIAAGSASSLTGIPLAIKDIFAIRGVRTTCASKILEHFVPPYDATAIAKLRAAGDGFSRQSQYGRICDGLLDRKFGLRRNSQSL